MCAIRRFCAAALISALTVLGLGAVASPAAARVIDHGHFHDVSSEVVEDFCGDLTVRIDIEIDGMFMDNSHGPNGLVYFMELHYGTVTYTNLANGKTVTSVFNDIGHDLKITDNGDGTLTVVTMFAGTATLEGPDGTVLVREAGTIRIEFLVDANGTPTDPSDDVLLDTQIVKEHTGLVGPDFCDTIHQFIG
jgi:hypothetical protein